MNHKLKEVNINMEVNEDKKSFKVSSNFFHRHLYEFIQTIGCPVYTDIVEVELTDEVVDKLSFPRLEDGKYSFKLHNASCEMVEHHMIINEIGVTTMRISDFDKFSYTQSKGSKLLKKIMRG